MNYQSRVHLGQPAAWWGGRSFQGDFTAAAMLLQRSDPSRDGFNGHRGNGTHPA